MLKIPKTHLDTMFVLRGPLLCYFFKGSYVFLLSEKQFGFKILRRTVNTVNDWPADIIDKYRFL